MAAASSESSKYPSDVRVAVTPIVPQGLPVGRNSKIVVRWRDGTDRKDACGLHRLLRKTLQALEDIF